MHNPTTRTQAVLVHLEGHYVVKANGMRSAKVFKRKTLQLGPRCTVHLQKNLSLVELTTRRHHAGVHSVDTLVNGRASPLGSFDLQAN